MEGWKSALPQLEGRDFVILSGVTRVLDGGHKEVAATPNHAFIPIANIVQIELLDGSDSGPAVLPLDREIDLTAYETSERDRNHRPRVPLALAALALLSGLGFGLYVLMSGEPEPAATQSAPAPEATARKPAGSAPQEILFLSDREGSSEIYVMPVTGGKARRLTSFGAGSLRPDRSPTDARVAFSSDRDGPAICSSSRRMAPRRATSPTARPASSGPVGLPTETVWFSRATPAAASISMS